MNDKRYYHLKDLNIFYLPSFIIKSFLTGLIFFIFPTTLLVLLTVNIVLLYIYNITYFLIVLYVIVLSVAYYSNKIVIGTLKNYGDRSSELDYDHIHLILTVISGVILLVVFAIVFTYFF